MASMLPTVPQTEGPERLMSTVPAKTCGISSSSEPMTPAGTQSIFSRPPDFSSTSAMALLIQSDSWPPEASSAKM